MQKIQMVDLQSQHARIQDKLDSALREVLKTTAFIRGPQVNEFNKQLSDYLQVKHAIGCANGTDALQIALMALDLPEGSEIITSDFTFVATAEVIRLLGLVPVLVDVDKDTFNILPEKIEKAITSRTKAIIPVHLFGQCANMDAIMDLAREHNLYVIEDTAQAIGASYKSSNGKSSKAGTMGDIGCTSFFPSKNLGCMGDGGAVFTNNDDLAKKMSSIANHGQGDQYYYKMIGINSRLDTLQAAVLSIKLHHLEEYNAARQKAASYYDEALKSIPTLQIPYRISNSTHIFHQYTLKILNSRRDEMMKHLADNGIPSKVYYPVPLHAHKPYAVSSKFDLSELKNTSEISEQVLSLPMHTELSKEQLEHITSTIKNFFA